MIILIGSQKGGAGKSTLAVNLAAKFAREGSDVVLVDADRQSTSANWCSDRTETEAPVVHCIQKYDDVRATLKDLNTRYEVVIVDAAGRDSKELRTAMLAASILIVPVRPSQPDLDTLNTMSEIIDQAKDFNEHLSVHGLFTMCPTNARGKEGAEAEEYVTDYENIPFLTSRIYDRKVYRDCMSEGLGVIEMPANKAADEIHALFNEVIPA